MTVGESGEMPVYLRLRSMLAAAILDGNYSEGDQLPSVRTFAADHGANPLTVAKAYQALQDDGYVAVKRGVGMFVAEGAIDRLRLHERGLFLEKVWPRVRAHMERLGIDPAELVCTKRLDAGQPGTTPPRAMVLKRLFSRAQGAQPQAHAVPAGQRIYAIGDIHGRLDLLDEMLDMIDRDDVARNATAETRLIFLGDYVDRGPDSKGVVERVMTLAAASERVTCLKGNHEEMLLRTVRGHRSTAAVFNRNGGRETAMSYGIDEDEYDAADLGDVVQMMARHVPDSHLGFLEGLNDWVRAGDYVFVHAGLRPGVPLTEQRASDMRWIREDFTESRADFGAMVIHGHSITEEVDARVNRIGIDTGAYATGRLTAIGLEGTDRWFLSTGTPVGEFPG